nr:hypothetical protein HmN_000917900 [Hymenolepis microstoma]
MHRALPPLHPLSIQQTLMSAILNDGQPSEEHRYRTLSYQYTRLFQELPRLADDSNPIPENIHNVLPEHLTIYIKFIDINSSYWMPNVNEVKTSASTGAASAMANRGNEFDTETFKLILENSPMNFEVSLMSSTHYMELFTIFCQDILPQPLHVESSREKAAKSTAANPQTLSKSFIQHRNSKHHLLLRRLARR